MEAAPGGLGAKDGGNVEGSGSLPRWKVANPCYKVMNVAMQLYPCLVSILFSPLNFTVDRHNVMHIERHNLN